MTTKIEWADRTWNPIIGCSKISSGCDNCYAERMACRLAHMGIRDYQDVTAPDGNPGRMSTNWFKHWNGETVLRQDELYKPLKWKKPERIFVCSMGDLFHESLNTIDILDVFSVMMKAKQHTFMLLTKRPDNALKFCYDTGIMPSGLPSPACSTPSGEVWPENIWLGVTVENQEQAKIRIPVLLNTPASVRFVSIEPMLSSIDLSFNVQAEHERNEGFGISAIEGIDWVICGGETGPGARPMATEWAIDIKDRCVENGVPFFFKKYGQQNKGRILDGQTWEQFPEVGK